MANTGYGSRSCGLSGSRASCASCSLFHPQSRNALRHGVGMHRSAEFIPGVPGKRALCSGCSRESLNQLRHNSSGKLQIAVLAAHRDDSCPSGSQKDAGISPSIPRVMDPPKRPEPPVEPPPPPAQCMDDNDPPMIRQSRVRRVPTSDSGVSGYRSGGESQGQLLSRAIRPSPPPASLQSRIAVPPNTPQQAALVSERDEQQQRNAQGLASVASRRTTGTRDPAALQAIANRVLASFEGSTKKRIRLGRRIFQSSGELFEIFSLLLAKTSPGETVQQEEADMLVDLVTVAHRDVKVKLGSGVVGVEVGIHPSYKGVKCFMLRRSDGTVIDVSYRKCINNLMSSRWVSQTPPLMRLRRISSIMLREKQRARRANNSNQQSIERQDDALQAEPERSNMSKQEYQKQDAAEIIAGVWDVVAGMENLDDASATVALTTLNRCCMMDEAMIPKVQEHPAFRELYSIATGNLKRYSPSETVQILSALSRMGDLPTDFPMDLFAAHNIPRLYQYSSTEMAAVMQSFASMKMAPPRSFFNAFTEEFIHKLEREDIEPDLCLSIATALFHMGKRPTELLRAMEIEVLRRCSSMTSKQIAQFLWTYSLIGWHFRSENLQTILKTFLDGFEPTSATWTEPLPLILNAVAKLRFVPTGNLWERIHSGIAEMMSSMTHRDLRVTLWSIAYLNLEIDPEILHELVERTVDGFCDNTRPQSRDAPTVSTQSLMSTALVLAMLRQFDHPRYPEMLRLLEGSTSKVLEDPLQTGMLHQFQMVMEVEAPHMKLNIKPEVLKMAETRWRKQAQEITVSPLHMRVAVALRDLGMSILIEHTTEDNHFSMDIALVPKDWNQMDANSTTGCDGESSDDMVMSYDIQHIQNQMSPKEIRKLRLARKRDAAHRVKVAIEVDGPLHFSGNTRQPLGSMLLRHRLLEARGWKIVSVPYYSWSQVPEDLKSAFLRMLLRDNGVDLGVFLPGFDRVKAVSLSEEERLMRLLMPWELAGVKSTDSGDVDVSDSEDSDGEDEPDTLLVDELTPSSSSDEGEQLATFMMGSMEDALETRTLDEEDLQPMQLEREQQRSRPAARMGQIRTFTADDTHVREWLLNSEADLQETLREVMLEVTDTAAAAAAERDQEDGDGQESGADMEDDDDDDILDVSDLLGRHYEMDEAETSPTESSSEISSL